MTKLAIFAAAIAISTAARAEEPINIDALRSATVQVGYLDLASARGQAVLKVRIAGAIEEVCGSYANVTEPTEGDRIDGCRVDARRSADEQLAARASAIKLAAADDRR